MGIRLEDGKTKPWRAYLRAPDGRQVSKSFRRKSDARVWLTVQESEKLAGTWVDPRAGRRRRFDDWAEGVLESRVHVSPRTRDRVRSAYDNQVEPYFGSLMLTQIRPSLVREWIGILIEDGLAPATIQKAYQVLMLILRAAVEERLIVSLPTSGVHLPKSRRQEMRFLEIGELNQLAEVLPDDARVLAMASAYTGLRWGELAALHRKEVDLDAGRLTVTQSLEESRSGVRLKEPKSRASIRSVRLPDHLTNMLKSHISKTDNPLVFHNSEGGFVHRGNFRRRTWIPAVNASVGPPMRFHDLRHTHAAMLIALGSHPKVIQDRLGHADIRTTLNTYGHLMVGLDEQVVEGLNSLISGGGDALVMRGAEKGGSVNGSRT